MEAGLFGFVLDEDGSGSLVVEEYLPEDEFEVVGVHVLVRLRDLVKAHISEVERGAEAVAGLRDGVDIAAALEILYVLLRTQDGGDVEAVMRQVVSSKYIRPFVSNSIEFAFSRGDEEWDGVDERVHDIVIVGLDLYEPFAHGGCIVPVLGRSGQSDARGHLILDVLAVIELSFVAERSAGVGDKGVFDIALLGLRLMAARIKSKKQRTKTYMQICPCSFSVAVFTLYSIWTTRSHLWCL